MESLEELRDLNRRHRAVDHDTMLAQYSEDSRTREEREKAEDEAEIRYDLSNTNTTSSNNNNIV